MKPSERIAKEITALQDELARIKMIWKLTGIEPDMCQPIDSFTVLTMFRNNEGSNTKQIIKGLIESIEHEFIQSPMTDPHHPNGNVKGSFAVSVNNYNNEQPMIERLIDVRIEMNAIIPDSDGKAHSIWIDVPFEQVKNYLIPVDSKALGLKGMNHSFLPDMTHCISYAGTAEQLRALRKIFVEFDSVVYEK